MPSKTKIALLACACGTVIALLVRRAMEEAPSASRSTAARTESAGDRQVDLAPGPRDGRLRTPVPQEGRTTVDGERRLGAGSRRVCRVVVIDADGGEHHGENGSFQARYQDDPRADRSGFTVTVEGGEFELPPRNSYERIGLWKVVLGGSSAQPTPSIIQVGTSGDVLVVARWRSPTTLRVVDAVTHADLTEIRLLNVKVYPDLPAEVTSSPLTEIMGKVKVTARSERSPIELPPTEDRLYWAHAPGYLWGKVEIDHEAGGVHIVELDRGGADLVVQLPTHDTRGELGPMVRVYSPGAEDDAAPLAGAWPRTGVARIVGIPEGRCEVRAEYGDLHEPRRVLARAEVELDARGPTEVRLQYEDPLANAPATLSGVIVLASPDDASSLVLSVAPAVGAPVRRLDRRFLTVNDRPKVRRPSRDADLTKIAGAPLEYAFSVEVTPGRYKLSDSTFWLAEEVEVGPSGLRGVRLSVEPHGMLVVDVLDDSTGEHLEGVDILYRPVDASRPWGWRRIDYDRVGLRFPIGEVALRARSTTHATGLQIMSITQDGRRVELRAHPRPSFSIRLVDGSTVLPIDPSTMITVTSPDGEESRHPGSGEEQTTVPAEDPGPHLIEIDPIPGFLPIDPVPGTASWGVTSEVRVSLTRR